jgi:hypothetical protein
VNANTIRSEQASLLKKEEGGFLARRSRRGETERGAYSVRVTCAEATAAKEELARLSIESATARARQSAPASLAPASGPGRKGSSK